MSKCKEFLDKWMLPLAVVIGIVSFAVLYFIPPFAMYAEPAFSKFANRSQPVFVAAMLFLQFNRVSPHDLKFKKWHFLVLAFQILSFITFALVCILLPHSNLRILMECALLCFVCPTAAAAGVVTAKLGGSLSDTVSYVVLINILAAFMIPLTIPIVHPTEGTSFFTSFLAICRHVFPLLVLPLLLAWLVRYTARRLQRWLMRKIDWAFYCWGISLTFAIYLATRALFTSRIKIWVAVMIGVISLVCCLIQFHIGHRIGAKSAKNGDNTASSVDSITAGQSLGQKNSGFLIWLGYSFMTPVTAAAGGIYSIWQNLVNSRELYLKSLESNTTKPQA